MAVRCSACNQWIPTAGGVHTCSGGSGRARVDIVDLTKHDFGWKGQPLLAASLAKSGDGAEFSAVLGGFLPKERPAWNVQSSGVGPTMGMS
ncbi:hypothetical protein HD806DRAFT_501625 [Xylariaceae sp. AK1471]|nr:hypothetical protein HD806DRAFT_501625 [Xylariaceae sp. AK1471]